ncbi:MAG TPA: hypothetical protein VEX62_09795 [Candidatus Limnocylindrales bacterium]|nr:hypothetical protein [Candidatus Limnocylindrales bacterium]
MSRFRLGLLATLVVGATLGACTSAPTPTVAPSNGPPGSPGLIGACQLVPDMDDIVGMDSVGPPAGYTLNDVDRCLWTYGLDPSRYVTLSIALEAVHHQAIGALGESESVADLGRDARWWPSNSTLSVLSGGNAVQVTLELDPADNTRELAIGIAQAAIEGL